MVSLLQANPWHFLYQGISVGALLGGIFGVGFGLIRGLCVWDCKYAKVPKPKIVYNAVAVFLAFLIICTGIGWGGGWIAQRGADYDCQHDYRGSVCWHVTTKGDLNVKGDIKVHK